MEYDAIARKIIEGQREIIGDVALRQAAKLPWIEPDDDGIAVTGEPDAADIDDLVSKFEAITGEAAVGRARQIVADLDLADLPLPDRLQPD